jgi:hypothetical protein
VAKHLPGAQSPTESKSRNRLHQQVDPGLLQEPECRARKPFDQDSKGQLGSNAYRMRRAEAIGKHWCLVFVAYSLLHLTCLPAGPDRTQGLIQTIGDACRQQGRAVLQRLLMFVHDQLSHGATVAQVFTPLFAKHRGMAPT